MVNENIRKLVERFSSKGYSYNSGSRGYYVDLEENAKSVLSEVLSEIKNLVEYQTVYKKADQDKGDE